MPTEIPCPACASANVFFSRKRGVHVCEDCGQIIDRSTGPLRIFLSYGHDANEELVLTIKADLELRGYHVWFDESAIKAGEDWRRAITEGIVSSNRVLSFLSKHSSREPGVCLDELAIAIGVKGGNVQTILVESEGEVTPPPTISHIQWLDMHDWKEQRAAGEVAWNDWYRRKFNDIVEVVESDQSRRFAGEIEVLERYLQPTSSDARVCALLGSRLVGRRWLFDEVERCRRARDQSSRLCWIVGGPGTGKSAFAAHLAHYGNDSVVAAQFCQYDKPDHYEAKRLVRTVAFQIATRLPDYRGRLLALPGIAALDSRNASELFDYLLTGPLSLLIDGGRQHHLIVIDALDEAGTGRQQDFPDVLARHLRDLPGWVRFVVTSRPDTNVSAALQGFRPLVLDAAEDANRQDLRAFLEQELGPFLGTAQNRAVLIERILARSAGVFLYLFHFCEEVKAGRVSVDNDAQLPAGLGGVYLQYFEREFPDIERFRAHVRPLLRAVVAARAPLPLAVLKRIAGCRDEELRDLLRPLLPLFPVTVHDGREAVRPYHKSLRDWLVDDLSAGRFHVSIAEGQLLLAELGWQEHRGDRIPRSPYFVRHLARHLAEAGRWDQLLDLMGEPAERLFHRWAEQGESDDGRFCLKRGIAALRAEGGSNELVATLMSQLARLEVRDGHLAAARQHLEDVADLLPDTSDAPAAAIAAHEYGSAMLEQGALPQALAWYRRALSLARRQQPRGVAEEAANLIGIASVYQAWQRNSIRVLVLANRALRLASQSADVAHEVAALRILGDVYKDLMRYEDAERYFSLGHDKAEAEGLPFALMALKNGRAWMEYQRAALQGQHAGEALKLFRDQIDQAARLGHRRFEIDGWVGACHAMLSGFDLEGSEKALDKIRELAGGSIQGHVLARYSLLRASLLHRRGGRMEALASYLAAFRAATETMIPARQADALVGCGAIRWHLGERVQAEADFKRAADGARSCALIRQRLVAASIARTQRDPSAIPL